jgi:uncharacterized protein (DUF305 family)
MICNLKAFALVTLWLLLAAMPMAMPVHSAADAGFSAAMTRMNRSMASAPMTGNSDHDFLVMMIPHHEGAVDMCRTELRYGRNPRILALCRDIIASQSSQIQEMRQLLQR